MVVLKKIMKAYVQELEINFQMKNFFLRLWTANSLGN